MSTKTEPWPDNFDLYLGGRYRHRETGLIYAVEEAYMRTNRIRLRDKAYPRMEDHVVTAQQLQRDWDEIKPEPK